MRVRLSQSEFRALFSDFREEAFRLETKNEYKVPAEEHDFGRYLRGYPLPESQNRRWCELLRRSIESGKRISRVHVVDMPLSRYLRFEIEWGYAYSADAGEVIYLLERNRLPEAPLRTFEDFWLFDQSSVVWMHYDEAGQLVTVEREDDRSEILKCLKARNELISSAVPLQTFLARFRSGEFGG